MSVNHISGLRSCPVVDVSSNGIELYGCNMTQLMAIPVV
jgi:hypothetical protein